MVSLVTAVLLSLLNAYFKPMLAVGATNAITAASCPLFPTLR
jgi:hypothetical protein